MDELIASGRYRPLYRVDILILLEKSPLAGAPGGGQESLERPSHLHPPASLSDHGVRKTSMVKSEQGFLIERLERQRKGIAILQEVLTRISNLIQTSRPSGGLGRLYS